MCPDVDDRSFAEVHARALNAHDVDLVATNAYRHARIIKDGHYLGEGRQALCKALTEESEGFISRVVELDGEPVIAEYCGDEGNEIVQGIVQFKRFEGRVEEIRIDHDADRLRRVPQTWH